MGVTHALLTGIKRLVSARSKKANGMQEVRDILLKSTPVLPKSPPALQGGC
ncbi:unnamed protein product [Prunus armeniaca]